jgi:hypothetical protein
MLIIDHIFDLLEVQLITTLPIWITSLLLDSFSGRTNLHQGTRTVCPFMWWVVSVKRHKFVGLRILCALSLAGWFEK